jgi:hypothetical protein
MPPRNKETKSFDEMSNEELAELQDGFIDLRNHATYHLEAILKEQQERLENNLIK